VANKLSPTSPIMRQSKIRVFQLLVIILRFINERLSNLGI